MSLVQETGAAAPGRASWACLAGCALALMLGSTAGAQENDTAIRGDAAVSADSGPVAASAPDIPAGRDQGGIPAPAEADPLVLIPEPAEPDFGEMDVPTEPSALAPEATLPQDLSPWGMYEAADEVVKGVMISLAFASFLTWTIWLARTLELMAASRRLRRGLSVLSSAESLDEAEAGLARARGPVRAMVLAARHETVMGPSDLSRGDGENFLARVSSHLSRIEAQAVRRLNVGVGVLATIGATAPFVGLFGTVWGIMNSFIGIAEAQTTNLAVVAPGIAEALLATALGLVAAIPAVVIYNFFARWITAYRARLIDAEAAVERLVSRDLDHRRLIPAVVARAAE